MVPFRNALIALLIGVVAARAQSHKAVHDLLDRIKGLSPEFAAKLILDVSVIVGKLPVKERIALYEEAFRMAAHAELATPLQGAGFHTDTRPGFRQMAGETGLDSLSLQYGAMLGIKALDARQLQRMFREMRPLNLQEQSCQDVLRPDLNKWAGAINLVYQTGFTADERAKEKDIAFVEDQVRAINSPLQLAHLSQVLVQADRRLVPRISAAFDSALAQVRGDWFAFEYASSSIGLGKSNAAAFRDYVVSHLRGVRCGPRWPFRKTEEPEAVTRFNSFAANYAELNLQSINASALEPSRVDESPHLEEFWKSERSKRLLDELRWLTHGNRKGPDSERFWTVDERRAMQWNERYLGFMKLLDQWNASDEPSPAAYFFMRSRVLLSLAKLVPPGAPRTNAFRNAVSWLNASFADGVVSRAEWWLFAKELLELAKEDGDRLDDLEHFGNPVLSTYAHVDNPRSTKKPGGWAHQK